MQTITLDTTIAAPIERCFLLSLSIDLHKESTKQTGEQAIAGVTHGLIGLNETVTWHGRHFGLKLTQETLITRYEKPNYFQDKMIRGLFKSFIHDHYYEAINGTTKMRDVLRFSAPLGILGAIAERVVLRAYLTRFLRERNEVIRRIAESRDGWKLYIHPADSIVTNRT
jgi:ligand-binding SRPBCC domain-containing protein